MFHKASVIKDKTIRLGASRRNILDFRPVSIANVPLSVQSSLVRRTSLVKTYPHLTKECASYVVPPLYAQCFDRRQIQCAISSGKRALYLPDHKYVINLRDLGCSETDVFQEFVVDIKGAGLRLRNSEHLSEEDARNFLRQHNLPIPNNISDMLIFSRNEYLDFDTPEGAQDQWGAQFSRDSYEYFSALGFKIAPVVCTVRYPATIQKLASSFDKNKALEDLILVQEKRLMPSFVRASFLEHNGDRNPELVRAITQNEAQLRALQDIFIEDMLFYFHILAATTERLGSRFYWDCLANIDGVLKNPDKMYNKSYAWYLAKDIVLAPTGMYFVDLEGALVDHDAQGKEELHNQHKIYLTALLKDFTRILTLYNIALRDERDTAKIKNICEASRDTLIARINQTESAKIEQCKETTKVTVHYEKIKQATYTISNDKILTV